MSDQATNDQLEVSTENPPEPVENTFGRSLWLLIMLVIAPLLYVLSIGPVVALWEWADWPFITQEMMETFYAPVLWLHEHTLLKEALEKYAEFWGWS